MIKRLVILVLVFSSLLETKAQQHLADSLERLLIHPQTDSLKSQRLIFLALFTEPYDTTKALLRYQEARNFAQQKNLPFYVGQAYRYEYGFHSITGNTQKQIEMLEAAIKILSPLKDIKSKNELGLCYMNLGNYYKDANILNSAVDNYLFSVKLLEEVNSRSLSSSLLGLSVMYENLKEFSLEYQYLNKALISAKIHKNTTNILMSYLYISKYYGYVDKPVLAKIYVDSCEPYFNPEAEFSISQTYYLVKATAFLNMLLYDSAAYYFEKSNINAIQHSSEFSTIEPILKIGFIRLKQNRYPAAEAEFNKGLAIAKKFNSLMLQRRAYEYLADIYSKMGKYKDAYESKVNFDLLDDSLYGEDKKKYSIELETKYQTEKKDIDLKRLASENKVQQLLIKQKNTLNYIMTGSFLTLLLISFLSYRTYKQKQLLQQQQIKQLQNEKLLLATESILKGQEDERSRLAQDLHA